MTKTLVIAEKPSVAQDIVRALTPVAGKFEKHEDHFENDRYVVTSAVGHLVEIQAPEQFDVKRGKWSFAHLPVIPPYFDLKPVDKTKSRLNAVVKLAKRKDVTELINACDAGREGELIFRLIEQSITSRTSSGRVSANASSSPIGTYVPVGLFGLQITTIFVFSPIFSFMAGRLNFCSSVTGTETGTPPFKYAMSANAP